MRSDVRTAGELRDAALAGRLRSARGVGPNTEARLLEALARAEQPRPRQGLLVNRARELVGAIADGLGGDVAGDPRRWRDDCEHLAVVCAAADPRPVFTRFVELPHVVALLSVQERPCGGPHGRGRPGRARRRRARAVRNRPRRAHGSRRLGRRPRPAPGRARRGRGLPRSASRGGRPSCARPARAGHVTAARLLELDDIRGDLHTHTTWSDGRASVEEMGRAARDRGYAYLAICDHTPAVGAVPGLTADDVRRQARRSPPPTRRSRRSASCAGIECDILPDGRLDLPDDVLAELDWVQASVHGGQRMPARR